MPRLKRSYTVRRGARSYAKYKKDPWGRLVPRFKRPLSRGSLSGMRMPFKRSNVTRMFSKRVGKYGGFKGMRNFTRKWAPKARKYTFSKKYY